jgi:uncharacterized cupredoxin-like copper-binding protein
MVRRTAFVLLLVFALGLVSLSPLSANGDEPGEPYAVYNITMKEYEFDVEDMEAGAPLEFEAGELYELHFTNAGEVEHEVLIGQNPLVTDAENNFHLDFEANLLDDVEVSIRGEMNDADFVIGVTGLIEFEINPGQELTLSFTLPEEKVGEWQIACFVSVDPDATEEEPGATHFDLGMTLPVVVSEPM